MTVKTFYKGKISDMPGLTIGTLLRRKEVKGDVGLEIEVEGNKFKKEGLPSPWVYHKDGSLRGLDNAEYVLAEPIRFDKVSKAISDLWDMFNLYGSVLDESNRTSVHVHLNAQKFHLNRLCSFMALYFSVEELLTEWCGDHRVGNLFCLRAKDAPAIISQLKQFFCNEGRYDLRDGLHYAGLNAQALSKFGSVEIRTMRGVNDPFTIITWVSILRRIYELSEEFSDPRAVCDHFSGNGPLGYLEMILGDLTPTIRNQISYTTQEIMDSLYDGIRLAQDLCYCRDWSLYKPIDLKQDPFGRDPVKLSQAMTQVHAFTYPSDSIQLQTIAYPPLQPTGVTAIDDYMATWEQAQENWDQANVPLQEGEAGDDYE